MKVNCEVIRTHKDKNGFLIVQIRMKINNKIHLGDCILEQQG